MTGSKRFRRERTLYQLHFEEPELDGFECVMSGVSLDAFIGVSALAAKLETPEGRTQENIEAQFTTLAGSMVSWNLDNDDGQPVPCDYEGLRVQDFDFVMKIKQGWMQALSSVPKASENDSPSGEISPERSLGLAAVSTSRAS